MSQIPPPEPPPQPEPPRQSGSTDAAADAPRPVGDAPQPLGYAPPPSGVDLRTIAVRQRAIIFCILGYVLTILAQFAFPEDIRFVPVLLALAIAVAAAYFVFMLSIALYNTGTGIVLGILTLIPYLGLIVLLIINGKATRVLRRHGIRIGLLGAAPSQILAPGTVPYR